MKHVIKYPVTAAEGLSSRDRAKIAKTTSNPRELMRLANDNAASVRTAVAQNKNTPSNALKVLAKDTKDEVREYVAQNPNTPPEVLAQLANDEYWGVRVYAAEHPNTPPEALAQLVNDEHWLVRACAADNPNTPPQALAQLANDEDRSARDYAAKNPNTPSRSKSRKAPSNEWSVKLYELENYSQIEQEIDDVLNKAAQKYAADNYTNSTCRISTTANSYDEEGDLILTINSPEGKIELSCDLQSALAVATSSQKKADCIKKLVSYFNSNLS